MDLIGGSRRIDNSRRLLASSRPNQSTHRMSGDNVNLKYQHREMPLIGALGR